MVIVKTCSCFLVVQCFNWRPVNFSKISEKSIDVNKIIRCNRGRCDSNNWLELKTYIDSLIDILLYFLPLINIHWASYEPETIPSILCGGNPYNIYFLQKLHMVSVMLS